MALLDIELNGDPTTKTSSPLPALEQQLTARSEPHSFTQPGIISRLMLDNSVAESFFGTLQLELLDEHRWQSRRQLAPPSSNGSSVVQPSSAPQLLQDAQSRGLRGHSRGMINTNSNCPLERGTPHC